MINTNDFQLVGSNGAVIRATAHHPDASPRGTVVLAHGFKGFKDWGFHPHLATSLAEAGYLAVRFDFSHNGVGDDSSTFERLDLFEQNTFSFEVQDLEVVLDHVRTWTNVDAKRIATIGHSRGGGMVLLHARHRGGVRAVATLAAIASTDRLSPADKETLDRDGRLLIPNARTKQLMPIGRNLEEDRMRNADLLDVERATAELALPIVFVHGTEDESVPFAEAERLAAAQPNARLEAIEGAGHTFGIVHPFAGDHPQWLSARTALIGFLDEHLAAR
ncbi:MAG: alpha/beta fold hydrolase [Planctomycetes bacterium]|nr:alpha/beta fold hydrolase [Planctomycetota bacterium]